MFYSNEISTKYICYEHLKYKLEKNGVNNAKKYYQRSNC